MNKPAEVKCGLYTRVSSRQQMECDYNSLESQKEKLEAYCLSQDGYVAAGYYEDGGLSGDTLDRPGLQKMIFDIRKGEINCVLVYKIDRLARSVRDFYTLIDVFEEYGVRFVSVTQNFDTSGPMGRLMLNILLDFAQFEREMIADRTRDKMRQRAERGLWNGGIPPYGYQRENKKLIRHPDESATILFMFECFASDPSVTRLRRELHQRGLFPRSGKKWLKTSLGHILHNPVYVGKVRSNGNVFAGEQEKLVDEQLFQLVQSLAPERTHAGTKIERAFRLKGLLKCGDCGSFLTPHYTQKRRKDGSINRIPYYRCTKTMHFSNDVCRVRSLSADRIEEAVIDNLSELSKNERYLRRSVDELNKDIGKNLKPLYQEEASLKARLCEIEGEIDQFVQALGKGKISVDRLEKEIESREQDRILLKSQLDYLQQKIRQSAVPEFDAAIVRKNLADFQAAFGGLTAREQAEALKCLLKAVTVFPDRIVLEVFDLPEFKPGSQNRPIKLPRLDSNQRPAD